MDPNSKSIEVKTHKMKSSENSDPNIGTDGLKLSKSPSITKSPAKIKKSVSKDHRLNPAPVISPSPQKKIRQRRFVVVKRNTKRDISKPLTASSFECKCNRGGGQKCLCLAYESLRASQEVFFNNGSGIDCDESFPEDLKILRDAEVRRDEGKEKDENLKILCETEIQRDEDKEKDENLRILCEAEIRRDEGKEKEENHEIRDVGGSEGCGGISVKTDCSSPMTYMNKLQSIEQEVFAEMGASTIKRTRDRLLEEARENVPEPGSGRVKHLVKAFEKLLSIRKSKDTEDAEEDETSKGLKWALPGLPPPNPHEAHASSSSFCPSEYFLTSESLGLAPRLASSFSSQGSISSRTSDGGRMIRRKSAESSRTHARRQCKRGKLKTVTSQKPFKLRTEERGKYKEEEFFKKVKEITEEEEKLRIPIAQGLPWTTDEPERLIKPQVKENTRPIDLVLHSDIRAVERAEFDYQVSEKWNLIEQYRMERDRLRKLAEEEEIRRLRKELVPKAQPMPYFDRPFIPRRSEKAPTIPKEPKFHIQHKKMKSCMSWNYDDMFMHHE
ncbi:unnamed protein product [Cuscuta europaea]|uniref:TPX2 C-terminal domain-containing protein n=1 Tax=Cuscuta europaea TaxID=41803 RepID=A0A9P0YLS1_CUSEU|nr:unnamed protein product [Cuscuta europaea]